VLDRASIFADPGIIKTLQTDFIPVAIDQFKQRRQKDAEGDFWRKIAGQSPRNNFDSTTQGIFAATASGQLLAFNNNRGVDKTKALLSKALDASRTKEIAKTTPLTVKNPDPRFLHKAPKGMRIARVHAKVLGGQAPTDNYWKKIARHATSHDTLWITPKEEQTIARDRTIPPSLARRIALFHLIDNTRGEPTFWEDDEIRSSELSIDKQGVLTGKVHLARKDNSMGYEADLRGLVEFENNTLTRFDLVAHGDYWGESKFTKGAPKGRFPLAISFRLVDGSSSYDQIPPQGSKSWWQNYLKE